LISLWITAFGGIALLMAAGVAALVFLEQQRVSERDRMQLDQQAQILGERISDNLQVYRHMLLGLSSNPDLVRWFGGGDSGERGAREQALAQLLPKVLRVRLLSPGHNTADMASEPPLSYASLLLLRAAETAAEPPPLEMLQGRTPKAHLVGVSAVRNTQGEVLGLVHLTIDPSPLRGWLDGTVAGGGRIELRQEVEGTSVTLTATPGTSAIREEPDGQHKLPGSLMALAYWYGDGAALAGWPLMGAVVILGVLLLAGAAVVWLQYKRMRATLDADSALMIGLAEDALAGHNFRREKVRLSDLAPTLELLTARLSAMKESAAEAPPEGKKPSKPAVVQTDTGGGLVAEPSDGGAAAGSQPIEAEFQENQLVLARLPEAIFHADDIRGPVADTLTAEVVAEIGRAVGSQAYDQGQQSVIVARDVRSSSKDLADALVGGLNSTGRDVIDLGIIPAPVLYFATHYLGSDCGVMVSGDQSPPDWNGLKVVLGGECLSGDKLIDLGKRVERGDLLEGSGAVNEQELVPDYIDRVTTDVSIARPLKVVLDCGGGCAAAVAPKLFRALGCELVELSCELDLEHPGSGADLGRPESLQGLQAAVLEHKADIGLAFGNSGARLGVVDSGGGVVWADRLMMLLSADVLARHPGGDVVFDVMCSRALSSQILQNGGRPVMWRSGNSALKGKLREIGALLAGDWSGHIIFRERWYGFEDAMYTGARLLEILALDPRSSQEVFAGYPEYVATTELLLPVVEGEQHQVMERVQQHLDLLGDAKLIKIDGVRAEFEDGWGLIRASTVDPALSFRFEADTDQSLERIQEVYRGLLAAAAPNLTLPF